MADYRVSVLGSAEIVAVGTGAVGTGVVADNRRTGTLAVVEAVEGLTQKYRGSGCVQGLDHSRMGC